MAHVEQEVAAERARGSFASEAEIDEFVEVLGKFERGELSADAWRAYRLVRGTYGQRQNGDAQMLRVKIPQGILTGTQLEALAQVAETYSRGFGHVTTRQNVQFHFVKLHEVELAMRLIGDTGLTTREACGNSVRNITACARAGVARDELFDVTPYAEALTRYLLRHPLSSSLPRKFKIAFEGCRDDHAITSIHDIGWRARVRRTDVGLERGFRVTVGGGTSILCASGRLLFDFLPASDLFDVAEAVIRVFHRHGDYAHKQRNRMKFLIKSLGWDGWRAAFDAELANVRAEGGARLPFHPDAPPVEQAPAWTRVPAPTLGEVSARAVSVTPSGPGLLPVVSPTTPNLAAWRATNTEPQKQPGYVMVTIRLTLGDITAGQMRVVADLARAYGDGTVRTTVDQNLVLRWVRQDHVTDLYTRLCVAGLGEPGAGTVADVTSCPGAESCRLAVTTSRGLGRMLTDHLATRPDLVARAPNLNIKISGCPNGCGQHHIAALGFQGSAKKIGGRAVPHYFVMAGGGAGDQGASFGKLVAKIPARRCTEAVDRLIALYGAEHRDGETPDEFFRRVPPDRITTTLADLERITPDEVRPTDLIDLGDEREFVPEVMEGECAS